MNKIKVNDLYFSYVLEKPILSGISIDFDLRSTAIIGQNGAGKTTFVKLLKGLLKPKKGDIWILDNNTKEKTVAQLSRYIGLVFQNPNDQIFKSKVIDEVMFGPLNIGQDNEEAKLNAKKALEMVGLDNRINDNPYDLSLSDRKLLSIASVIAMNTEIVILDEPTIAQDHRGKEKIKEIIKNLKNENKLVITIIHDMDFVAETFDRTIVFNKGKVLLDGDTRFVYSHDKELKEAYLEAPNITRLAKKLGIKETILTVEEFYNYCKNNR